MSMKSTLATVTILTLHLQTTLAFTPTAFTRLTLNDVRSSSSTLRFAIDPSVFTDISHNADTIQSFFSTISLSDAAASAGDVVEVAKDPGNGWFGFLEGPIEQSLNLVHGGLISLGISGNAWGLSIIVITSCIKLFTYPLTAQQLQSTGKMQAIQPKVKEIQDTYASNPEVMNKKVSEMYQTNEINPLAGCIPSIVQIPVFIGLYRAVLTLAKDNKLDEPFLFLPNLEGPTYGADPAHASDWILKGWVDGVPSLGWVDTASFLAVPIILIISQGISMQLMAPKDQEQPSYLKFLPLLIGWFSLNVPAALGIYWVANNLITTALTLQIKSGITDTEVIMPAAAGSGGGASVVDVSTNSFNPAPIREKPAGFTSMKADGEVTPITPVDAEIVSKIALDESVQAVAVGGEMDGSKKKRGGSKKKKRKNKKKN